MRTSSTQVLVVDDFEEWRRFYCSILAQHPQFEVIGEATDALEAVQQAQERQPALILLDIGLPTLNGIEAARRIRNVSSESKILFISENRSREIVEAALSSGAGGYVLKSDAAGDLLPAVNAVLEGKQFISASLTPTVPQSIARFQHEKVRTPIPAEKVGRARGHAVGFYSHDRRLSKEVTRFIGAALEGGNAAIVIATESHRESLLLELKAAGFDIAMAIDEGRYIALDAADTLSMLMVNGMPDPVRVLELFGDLIVMATEAVKGEHPCVSLFGECVNLLWAQGNLDAAIQLEKLGNKLTHIHDVDILCGYSVQGVEVGMDDHTFQQICAQHSAVYSQR